MRKMDIECQLCYLPSQHRLFQQEMAMYRLRRHTDHRGFTLIELLVVIVIIGLLAAYVGPRYFAQLSKSEVKTAESQIQSFGRALDTYRLDVGRYPSTEQGLKALTTAPQGVKKWNGPYLEKAVPLDPWQHPYVYTFPDKNNRFALYSRGPDGNYTNETEERISYY